MACNYNPNILNLYIHIYISQITYLTYTRPFYHNITEHITYT